VTEPAPRWTFWAYNDANNLWSNPLDPADAGVNIQLGGALVDDGRQYTYALQGNSTRTFLASGHVSEIHASASPTLVMGVSEVAVRMTITSDTAIDDIATVGNPTYVATGGATATFSSPTLVSPDNQISGSGDPVIYEWIATVTPGADIGSIIFTVNSSLGVQEDANSVIVTPVLTYSVTVDADPPAVIENTAVINESGLTINNEPSNTTRTTVTPTLVVISAVRARVEDGVAVISWEVPLELDTVGYHLVCSRPERSLHGHCHGHRCQSVGTQPRGAGQSDRGQVRLLPGDCVAAVEGAPLNREKSGLTSSAAAPRFGIPRFCGVGLSIAAVG
jgi:hypothetical protein